MCLQYIGGTTGRRGRGAKGGPSSSACAMRKAGNDINGTIIIHLFI